MPSYRSARWERRPVIAGQIMDGGGDYVLGLKANQVGLYEAVIEYVDNHLNDDFTRINTR